MRVRRFKTPKGSDYYVTCDRTGMQVPASQTKVEWNGLRVWEGVFFRRQPQDFVKAMADKQFAPNARPAPEPNYISATSVTADDL